MLVYYKIIVFPFTFPEIQRLVLRYEKCRIQARVGGQQQSRAPERVHSAACFQRKIQEGSEGTRANYKPASVDQPESESPTHGAQKCVLLDV